MRMKPSGEERERGLAEKDLREKHSQVLLSQRIQHIRRLRASRREDVMATEWYCPTKSNPDWRYAAEGERPRGEGREAAAMEELTAMLDYHAERGAGGSVVNVYAKEEEAAEAFAQKLGGSLAAFDRVTQASNVPGGVPPPVPLGSVASTPAVVGRALKRHDYAPLTVWRCLRRWAGNAEGEACTYNGIRGTGKYVVILVDPNPAATTLVEGLNRMRIIPPSLAAVVGVTPLSCPELARLAKKAGLTATGASTSTYLLSDTSYSWMDAHGLPRLSLRPWLLILDGKTGMVLSVKRDPTPGTLNDAVMEVVGDWRGKR
ncbi:hypothetical protein NSK_002662 [Nannochloropsis salina CCMP1776]|uniref:Uncharacterized protein n=1 Tax=Nannochloropsis salina CCMP1776 TaxID=1027361 RepID=A0A4D9D2T7_9STRA|nr:hypothetical protein NSK_002662 [Nannochloropsis salina CCMP1776]|eukprot:TFJ85842.1 hypothetical protein NSK_002662 [Nannochloropsis salina CCMP1776]